MIKKLERDARECEKDLIANLKSFWRKHGKTILNYGLVPVSDKATGVGGNTYRAYGGFRGKSEPKPAPSKIFRDWIEKKSNLLAQSPQSIGNSYKRFHRKLLSSLCVHWNAATGLKGSTDKFPKFPHAAKLIDLHIKHIAWHGLRSARQRNVLIKIAYQPLDIYSLALLRPFFSAAELKKIPKDASMGFVKDPVLYYRLQEKIRYLCKKARVPVFAFDQYAWNMRD